MSQNSPAASSGGKKLKKIITLPLLIAATVAITLTGGVLGSLLGILHIAIPSLQKNDVWVTGEEYLEFLGIWLLAMILFAAIRKLRPIFGALVNKVKGNTFKMTLLGIGIGFGMNGFCALVAILNGDIHIYFDSFNLFYFIFLFAVVFIQSSAEELMCRCFLYQSIMRSYRSPVLAITVNSLLFGAMHLFNPGVSFWGIADIIITGFLFSVCVYYLDSFWCCAAIHTAWNFTQNILLGLPNSGNVVPYSVFKLEAGSAVGSFAYDPGFGIEGTPLACLVQLAVLVLIVFWGRKHGAKPTDIWADAETADKSTANA